ncbi:MAG: GHKL domain-containing protein [Candidatus Omnitrophica bacterium]|nr:GHKL domain-containing protein [Candidatus Omnitrophota bacterium]
MLNNNSKEELLKKYKLAGKIRFISFSLLLFFLLSMKFIGGYSYLNFAFIALIFVESVLNQPYKFFIHRVNLNRFQYYQMVVDIIAISWILYYMGGIKAPVVNIAYYAVILWAGVVSSTSAVFFAAGVSALFFSSIVLLEHFGLLPSVSFYDHEMSTSQMISLLIANVSFLFAFGYFSANSSTVIQFLQRKKQEGSLRNMHRFLTTGYLVGGTVHDIQNCLIVIKGYAKILLENVKNGSEESEFLKGIAEMEHKSSDLLSRLARFSRKPVQEFESIDIHKVIEDALKLTWPLTRYSKMTTEKILGENIPVIRANKNQLQEIFVAFILNSIDAISQKGKLVIKTTYLEKSNVVEIAFSDTGRGIKREDLKRIREPFFTTKETGKGAGLGLTAVYGIIDRHKGKINIESTVGKGSTFTIQLPVVQSARKK